MYQLSLSIAKNKLHWLNNSNILIEKLNELDTVYANCYIDDRILFCYACDENHTQQLKDIVVSYLIDLYLSNVKKEFIKKTIRITTEYFDILVSILTSFDREGEEKLLKKIIKLSDEFSIDGYFYFRLQELTDRWTEICSLTKENAFFFSNKETLLELIRFLMSTIKPKIDRVIVSEGKNNAFDVINQQDKVIASFDNADELLLHLIDIAPLEINLIGDILDSEQTALLSNIFEEKFNSNNIIIPSFN